MDQSKASQLLIFAMAPDLCQLLLGGSNCQVSLSLSQRNGLGSPHDVLATHGAIVTVDRYGWA